MEVASHLWVVVLAGGEGRRIQEFTRDPRGRRVPKQFFCFHGDRSLLQRTIDRALRLTTLERVLVVVSEGQRAWWEPELRSLPRWNVLSQSSNRGTGVAVLRAVVEIARRDPDAVILTLPSDHEVEDELSLRDSLREAARSARARPNQVVLIGMAVEEPDCEYGWIVPGAQGSEATRAVSAFVEKPGAEVASRLANGGALVSTFMFAATTDALLRLYGRSQPGMVEHFPGWSDDGVPAATLPPVAWYERLPALDFSRDLLERSRQRLRVLAVPPCGWTDLGTPQRLQRWLAQHHVALEPAS